MYQQAQRLTPRFSSASSSSPRRKPCIAQWAQHWNTILHWNETNTLPLINLYCMARPITPSITAIGLLIDGFRRDKSEYRIPVVSAPIAYIGVQEGSDFSELLTLRRHLEDIANFSARKYAPTTLRFGRDNNDLLPDSHTLFFDNLGTEKYTGVLSDVPNKVPSLGQPFPSLEHALKGSGANYQQVEEIAARFRYG